MRTNCVNRGILCDVWQLLNGNNMGGFREHGGPGLASELGVDSNAIIVCNAVDNHVYK